MRWDDRETWITGKKKVQLDKLIQAISSCGVSFSFWEKGNADGKGSGTGEWTSLMGYDRKTLLKNLPSKLEPLLQQLWQNCGRFIIINQCISDITNIDIFFLVFLANETLLKFCALLFIFGI